MDRKTVVVAEDYMSSRQVIKASLEKLGMKVLEAGNGKDALRYFESKTPIDLLITDYNMPLMNGNELIEKVRGMQEYFEIPILVLSAESDLNIKERAVNANITGWIKKPFQVESFVRMVRRAMRLDREGQE